MILTSLLGQPRILLSMADDGLLPPAMSRCHPRFKTPHVATVVTGIGAALIAGVFPLDVLADLISIGILLAFAVVCIGVLVMRHTRPDVHRPFRVPAAWLVCPLGAFVCAGTTYFLSNATWIRLVVWTALGCRDLRSVRVQTQQAARRTMTPEEEDLLGEEYWESVDQATFDLREKTPAAEGYWMPAEFEPHDATWLLWPERTDNWREGARPAQEAVLKVAAAIRHFEPVHLGVSPENMHQVREHRPGRGPGRRASNTMTSGCGTSGRRSWSRSSRTRCAACNGASMPGAVSTSPSRAI